MSYEGAKLYAKDWRRYHKTFLQYVKRLDGPRNTSYVVITDLRIMTCKAICLVKVKTSNSTFMKIGKLIV